ncbi:helix-turn-helix domain-containing protein [Streptomyces sp. NPDC007084]|uniref:helix-turn-helix domain-containing protein n=1 Tax=Streptomyces sp. NPDC007084 TaxID=3154313 RepID=UPI0034549565
MVEKGPEQVTTQAIAQEAGVEKGTLFRRLGVDWVMSGRLAERRLPSLRSLSAGTPSRPSSVLCTRQPTNGSVFSARWFRARTKPTAPRRRPRVRGVSD